MCTVNISTCVCSMNGYRSDEKNWWLRKGRKLRESWSHLCWIGKLLLQCSHFKRLWQREEEKRANVRTFAINVWAFNPFKHILQSILWLWCFRETKSQSNGARLCEHRLLHFAIYKRLFRIHTAFFHFCFLFISFCFPYFFRQKSNLRAKRRQRRFEMNRFPD